VRILVLNWRDLAHPQAGGAEVYTEQVLRRWAAAGHDVTLLAARVDGSPAEELVDGYRVVRVGGRFTVYREARRWWRTQGRGRFDVVVDATNTVPFFAHEWVDDGARTIALVHQTCEEIWHHNAPAVLAPVGRHLLEPRWLRRLGRSPVLAVSDSTKAALERFGASDVTVVPEGFEPPVTPVLPAKEERPTLVFCARMVPYKRPEDVVEAVRLAADRVPGLQAWMIGGGPELERLRATAPENVTFFGRVDEDVKLRLMSRAHAHVATSIREGWGLVVSEAAALGTRTIAYDTPGLRDSTAAAGGVTVPPSPEALAEWVATLLPRWQREPFAPLAHGGAHSWDHVARVLFRRVCERSVVPAGAARRLTVAVPVAASTPREVRRAS
jgi:glycosyltransferase involved in cell wall biosynthesis